MLESKLGDFGIEVLAVRQTHIVVTPHRPHRGGEGAKAGIIKRLPGI
jgi:hypothetical protein